VRDFKAGTAKICQLTRQAFLGLHIFPQDIVDRRRGWDVRVLESQSQHSVFLCLLALVFVFGGDMALIAYQVFHLHRLDWSFVFLLPVFTLLAFRYGRLIYRRLGQ
jgi:hypothetical protein